VWLALVTAFFVFQAAFATLIVGSLFLGSGLVASLIQTSLIIGALAGALPLGLAILDRAHRTPVEGQVLRNRRFERKNSRSGASDSSHEYWIALDDGLHRRVYAYATDEHAWRAVRGGDIVCAVGGAPLGRLAQVQVRARRRRRART